MSRLRTRPFVSLFCSLLCLVVLSGCPEAPETKKPESTTTTETPSKPVEEVKPEIKPDDADAIQALEEKGVKLTKNSAGSVTNIDAENTKVTDEDLGVDAQVPLPRSTFSQ
ncbi:MAG: hypothetical protein R3C11_13990 [Planctomycetaceae bacterium]